MNIKKKDIDKFMKAVERIATTLGAVPVDRPVSHNIKKWKLPLARENSLSIMIFPKNYDTELYSVFTSYEHPFRSVGNKFSGKDNFHLIGKHDVGDVIEEFNLSLKGMIETAKTAAFSKRENVEWIMKKK